MATINWSLQHKRDTAANWTANNPTLLAGQIGIETDNLTTTPKFKIGDGSTAWNTLPYFYGGALSAQNLSNVLSVGNTTGGLNLVVTNDDIIQIGTTANRYIGFSTATVTGGLEIVNLNSNDHIILQDSGGIHIDTSKVILEQLTASRILSLNANKEIVNETGTGFLKLTAGVISYDNSSYQPLDSDLTSWAGVTRASGFDTFATTPSSANLSSLLTDKTGTGVNVFGTSPTFTTDITTPQINATSTDILINGNLKPSTTNNRSLGGASNIWSSIHVNNTITAAFRPVNATIVLQNAGATLIYGTFDLRTAASGTCTNFTFDIGTHTGQTASTEISNFKVNGASKTWANGGAATTIALQRWNYFTANTAATSGGGSLTITNSYGVYAEAATASGVTITNNYAAGFGGNINIIGTPYVSGVAGVDGTFTTADAKTVTVTKGIITSIV